MKKRVWLWRISGSFAFAVLYLAFIGYTADHWPAGRETLRYILIAVLGASFLWWFAVRPFLAGWRGGSK